MSDHNDKEFHNEKTVEEVEDDIIGEHHETETSPHMNSLIDKLSSLRRETSNEEHHEYEETDEEDEDDNEEVEVHASLVLEMVKNENDGKLAGIRITPTITPTPSRKGSMRRKENSYAKTHQVEKSNSLNSMHFLHTQNAKMGIVEEDDSQSNTESAGYRTSHDIGSQHQPFSNENPINKEFINFMREMDASNGKTAAEDVDNQGCYGFSETSYPDDASVKSRKEGSAERNSKLDHDSKIGENMVHAAKSKDLSERMSDVVDDQDEEGDLRDKRDQPTTRGVTETSETSFCNSVVFGVKILERADNGGNSVNQNLPFLMKNALDTCHDLADEKEPYQEDNQAIILEKCDENGKSQNSLPTEDSNEESFEIGLSDIVIIDTEGLVQNEAVMVDVFSVSTNVKSNGDEETVFTSSLLARDERKASTGSDFQSDGIPSISILEDNEINSQDKSGKSAERSSWITRALWTVAATTTVSIGALWWLSRHHPDVLNKYEQILTSQYSKVLASTSVQSARNLINRVVHQGMVTLQMLPQRGNAITVSM